MCAMCAELLKEDWESIGCFLFGSQIPNWLFESQSIYLRLSVQLQE